MFLTLFLSKNSVQTWQAHPVSSIPQSVPTKVKIQHWRKNCTGSQSVSQLCWGLTLRDLSTTLISIFISNKTCLSTFLKRRHLCTWLFSFVVLGELKVDKLFFYDWWIFCVFISKSYSVFISRCITSENMPIYLPFTTPLLF